MTKKRETAAQKRERQLKLEVESLGEYVTELEKRVETEALRGDNSIARAATLERENDRLTNELNLLRRMVAELREQNSEMRGYIRREKEMELAALPADERIVATSSPEGCGSPVITSAVDTNPFPQTSPYLKKPEYSPLSNQRDAGRKWFEG